MFQNRYVLIRLIQLRYSSTLVLQQKSDEIKRMYTFTTKYINNSEIVIRRKVRVYFIVHEAYNWNCFRTKLRHSSAQYTTFTFAYVLFCFF